MGGGPKEGHVEFVSVGPRLTLGACAKEERLIWKKVYMCVVAGAPCTSGAKAALDARSDSLPRLLSGFR